MITIKDINYMEIKFYLYLNINCLYIYRDFKSEFHQSHKNVTGVQNAGEMPL